MLKLSIIVPIYNVQPYLRKCVESLCQQDLRAEDYEIILVDDGSTDGSGELCDELATASLSSFHHSIIPIRVVHRENGGLSAARNSGIEVAQGEYLMFVDSDDYLEPNILGGLIAQCERENLDVLRFDYQNVRLKSERMNGEGVNVEWKYEAFEPNKYPHQVDRRTDVTDGETYLNERMGYACYAVMFIVKRNLLVSNFEEKHTSNITHNTLLEEHHTSENNVLFTSGIHFEDVDWTPRMMLKAKRVNATQTVVYNYLVREGSITKTGADVAKKRKNIEDCMSVIERLGGLYQQYPKCPWLRNMQSSMACGMLTGVARQFYSDRADYIRRMKAIGVFPLAIANQGRTYRRKAKLVNILGAGWYCWIMERFYAGS